MAIYLSVPFKGNRNYLHSTDIFNAAVAQTGVVRNLRLKFTKQLTSSIEMVPAEEVEHPAKAPARFLGVTATGQDVDMVIRPTAVAAPLARVPYDEDGVVVGSRSGGNCIEDSNGDAATPIERIVALNKKLIQTSLAPPTKLFFTSISLSHVPVSPRLRLELRSHVGTRIFRSAIFSEETELGDIWFYGV